MSFVSKVGHVLKVRDLDRALSFYVGVLGLQEVARRDFGDGPMAFLSTGNSHHDVALVEAREGAGVTGALGLHHVALKVVIRWPPLPRSRRIWTRTE